MMKMEKTEEITRPTHDHSYWYRATMRLTHFHMTPDHDMPASASSVSMPGLSHEILHTFLRHESTCHKHVGI